MDELQCEEYRVKPHPVLLSSNTSMVVWAFWVEQPMSHFEMGICIWVVKEKVNGGTIIYNNPSGLGLPKS